MDKALQLISHPWWIRKKYQGERALLFLFYFINRRRSTPIQVKALKGQDILTAEENTLLASFALMTRKYVFSKVKSIWLQKESSFFFKREISWFILTVQATNSCAFETFRSPPHERNSSVAHQHYQPKSAWRMLPIRRLGKFNIVHEELLFSSNKSQNKRYE